MDGILLWSRRGYRPIDGSHFIDDRAEVFKMTNNSQKDNSR